MCEVCPGVRVDERQFAGSPASRNHPVESLGKPRGGEPRRSAQRHGKIIRPDKNAVDAVQSGDLLNMFQRSGCFALRHEDRALVRGGEIVAYLLQLGQEPVFRTPRKSESARSQRVIFRVFHQPARFFHRLHVGDDDAPGPEIQRVEHGGARGITHAHKRLRTVGVRWRGDVEVLANHFLHKFSAALGKRVQAINAEARDLLYRYPWPGNVRELENAIERAVNVCGGQELMPCDFPSAMLEHEAVSGPGRKNGWLWAQETETIRKAIRETNGNLRQAAILLGISRSTLYLKIKKSNLSRDELLGPSPD